MSSSEQHPPRARLVLRVGVTGHRPNRLKTADTLELRERVHEILKRLTNVVDEAHTKSAGAYLDERPVLRLISALAEGADRIVAEEALRLGWELQAVLPFPSEQYEHDFVTIESREEFQTLLTHPRTSAIFELDGCHDDSPAAYEAAGRMVIRQCDVLLAVWDGFPGAGQGGTSQIIDEALALSLPTICIAARRPHAASVLSARPDGGRDQDPIDRIDDQIMRRLIPPPSTSLQTYFAERQHKWTTWGVLYTVFQNLLNLTWHPLPFRIPDVLDAADRDWRGIWPSRESIVDRIEARFLVHYAWADNLAKMYVNLYRSSFVSNFLLGGVAVLLALLPFGAGWNEGLEPPFIFAELVVIIVIIVTTWRGNSQHWHDRWIDDRLLAEQLRHLRFLMPMGRTMPSFRLPAYAAHDDPSNTWVSWHFRAIVREAGMASARINAELLRWYRDLLINEMDSQITYHRRNAQICMTIVRRAHAIGYALFGLTALVVVLHFLSVRHFLPGVLAAAEPLSGNTMTMLSAVLPAFGAALAAILGQAEFHRMHKRSRALADALTALRNALQKDARQVWDLAALGRIAEAAAEAMTAELLDWRSVFLEKTLTLPA